MHQRILSGIAPALFILAAGIGGGGCVAGARGDLERAVDAIFSEYDRADGPGAAVAVVHRGEIAFMKGYGMANLDHAIPITPATVFDIASVSKHFTAFAIALLAERGRLSLDDDVRKYVPELPDLGHTVTIRHLVHHTSGIRDWVELLYFAGYDFDDVIGIRDVFALARDQRALNFPPGTEYMYSNTGYNLLAEIVARVDGRPFREFMAEEVFEPLGMTSTEVQDDHSRIVRNRAESYEPLPDGGYRRLINNTAAVGSSSILTTVSDLARWARNFENPVIGGPAVMERMQQRGVLNDGREIDYAFGLSHGELDGRATIGHGGSWRGFRSHFLWIPAESLTVIVVSNVTAFNAARMAQRVARAFLGAPDIEPEGGAPRRSGSVAAAALDASRLAEYEGEYVAPELNTRYHLSARDGRLVWRHRRHGETPLSHVAGDRFVAEGVRGQLTFEFVRDSRGRVTGYTLAGARFRNIQFEREGR